jgi:hypothetical protein
VQALLWIVAWGLLLRGWLIWRLERGLSRDIRRLLDGLSPMTVLGPMFDELLTIAHAAHEQAARIEGFRGQSQQLRGQILDEGEEWQLAHLRSAE